MAQKMAQAKVASKKAAKKPSSQKQAHPAPGAKIAKPKHAAAVAQTHAKRVTKPATARTPAKAPAKAPSKAPAKPHTARQAAPQASKKAAAPKAPVHKAPARKAPARKAPAQKTPAHKDTVKTAARAPTAPKHQAPTKAIPKAPPMPPPVPTRPATAGARSMPAAVTKTANQKIIAPAAPTEPAAVQPATAPPAPQQAAGKPASAADKAAAAAAAKKPVHQRLGFKISEWIVYPAHGVGRIVAIEEQEIAGIALELFVITFEKDKMTLRVPTGKSSSVGMRKLAEEPTVKKAIETLKGRARVKRTMWSRRAQEYEAKINSGDLIAIAEVVRDLYRSESQPEQSYSERQLYEAALDRMAREIAVVEKLDERGAVQRITDVLSKSARGRRLAAEEAEEKEEKAA